MSKPLMNRLLLENSNKPADKTLVTSEEILALEWNQDGLFIEWKPPQKSEDIREQVRQITGLETIDLAAARVLFRKVAEGLDNKDFVIT